MLNARFFDDEGRLAVEVVDNELRVRADAWDIEAIGTLLKVRRGLKDIAFEARLQPPHGLYVRALDYNASGWRLRTNSKGAVQMSHQRGTRVDFRADMAMVHDGPLELHEDGKAEFRGGTAMVPYPAKRFRRWSQAGDIRNLLWELTAQPQFHVTALRDPRRPVPYDALQGTPLNDGRIRYAVYCEVCNEDRRGWRDLPAGQPPPPRSGVICARCEGVPPDAWGVTREDGTVIARFEDRGKALARGHALLKETPTHRLVVHRDGARPAIFFADGP